MMPSQIDNKLLMAVSVVAIISIIGIVDKKRKRKSRRKWCRSWLERRNRGKGILQMLNKELKVEDEKSYQNFLRLTNEQFTSVLALISPIISKTDTKMRDCIPARSKLEVTLRFLATGESFRSLMYSSRIHESTISLFVPEVCNAIIEVLYKKYLKFPQSIDEWMKISADFDMLWQFPHCIGALDGRHITFRAPISSGSYYYNYKGTNSIVLLGLVDANYKFIYVNIGVNGRISDGGVFNQSNLGIYLKENKLNLPPPEALPGQMCPSPYVIIADDAFPCLNNLVKPYSGHNLSFQERIFNYRLSRARRIVESAFGILANRFRVLLNPIHLCPTKVETITLTCVLLHNFLAVDNTNNYLGVDNIEVSSSNSCLQKIERQMGNRSSLSARQVRDNFKKFFNSDLGSVSWQESSVNKGDY